MQIRITSSKTGEVATISRSVCTEHPTWVHGQLGTASESELQRALDGLNVGDWYDDDGKHLGPDCCGVEMFRSQKTYVINTECGVARGIVADSVGEAKEKYEASHHYDFDGALAGEYPGSWYWIDEDGIRVEDHTKDMP